MYKAEKLQETVQNMNLTVEQVAQEFHDEEQEVNLSNVLLINPKNDEAVYMLTLLKIKQSDYNQANELVNKFILICKSFCSKKKRNSNKAQKIDTRKC